MDGDSRIKFFLEVGWARAAIIGWCMVPFNATLFSIHRTHTVQDFFSKRLPPRRSIGITNIVLSLVPILEAVQFAHLIVQIRSVVIPGSSLFADLTYSIKGAQVNSCFLRPSHCLLEMGSFLGIARVLFLSLLVSAVVAGNGRKCQNPKIRREWRNLTTSEQADWIRAINVLISWFSHCSSTAN